MDRQRRDLRFGHHLLSLLHRDASFTGITPGIFDVSATADWSAVPENMGLPASSCISTASAPQSITVVAVTNVTTTTHHMAAGGTPVTLTAHMVPISVPDKVSWSFAPEQGGGNLFANGLTAQFPGDGNWPTVTVRTTCGTTSHDTVINVYHLLGITVSSNLAAAGDPITLTAITDPPNCPLPITWNIGTNTGATITNAFAAGTHQVTASLGSTTQTVSVTSVGVKEILYEWPANSENWQSWTNQLLASGVPCIPVGETFRVKAMPEPEGAEFPMGWPQWSGAASGSGAIATASYGIVSTNSSDYQPLTATCGTSSRTEQALVIRIDRILVATNHVAIGTNTLALTAEISPAGLPGAEYLVGWECTNATLALGAGAGMDFPCNQSGIFTVTATAGSSAVSTNLFVYRVTGLTASANPVAVGETNVSFTAIVEPAGCPLPLEWSINGSVLTNAPGLGIFIDFPAIGMEVFEVGLGTSTACVDMWTVGVKDLKYQNPETLGWDAVSGVSYERVGTQLKFRAIRDPEDAPAWPAGFPVWTTKNGTYGPPDERDFIYSDVSLTMAESDKSFVKASCGTSSKSATTIVFDMTLSNVPEEDWTGRSYSRFGLGEVVTVTNTVVPTGLAPVTAGVQMWPADDNHYRSLGGGGLFAQQGGGISAKYEFVTVPESTQCWLTKRGSNFTSSSVTFIQPTQILAAALRGPSDLQPGEGDAFAVPIAPLPPTGLPPIPTLTPSILVRGVYRLTLQPNDVSFTKMTYHQPASWFIPQLFPAGVDAGSLLPKWDSSIQLPTPGNDAKIGIVHLVYQPELSEGAVLPNNGASRAVVRHFFEITDKNGATNKIDWGPFDVSGSFGFDWSARMEAAGSVWTNSYGFPPPAP